MIRRISMWFRTVSKKIYSSIAFIPAIIAVIFLILSFVMIQFDFSETGKAIKSGASWLSLKDASTARSIISAITGGVISLTVFSFSMVMILLNQAASQMSNRILDKLIGNRFQQMVLGFYIGTIVYALFLLSTIRDINSGIYVPAISTYTLIALTVVDIFLFIYFLHYVTQSVKYETIIHRIHNGTSISLKKSCFMNIPPESQIKSADFQINTEKSGVYQGFAKKELLSICEREDLLVEFTYPDATFLVENMPVMSVKSKTKPDEDLQKELCGLVHIGSGQDINSNYYYGFRQLMEVAVKALSPGINDPGTAIMSLHALADLFAFRLCNHPVNHLKDKNGQLRIITCERSFTDIFMDCMYPIWDYGKTDRLVLIEFRHILTQLQHKRDHPEVKKLLELVQHAIKIQEA